MCTELPSVNIFTLETLKESGNLFLLWNRQTFDRNTFLQELKEEVIDKYAVETNREMNFEHKRNDILQLLLQNRFNVMDDGYISFPNSLKQKRDVNMIIDRVCSIASISMKHWFMNWSINTTDQLIELTTEVSL